MNMIHLDMYQTIAAAVVALMLGKFLRKRVNILERFCILPRSSEAWYLQC